MRKAISRVYLMVVTTAALIGSGLAHAAEAVTPEQWQQLTSDKAFSYRDLKEASHAPRANNNGFLSQLINSLFGFFGSGIGNLILWLLVLGVIGFILYKLFISQDSFLFGKPKRRMGEVENDEEDEDITTTNWEELMQQAVKAGEARQAVRYSYMWLLRLLQQENLINYRIDKTNYDYYAELSESPYKQPFRQLSRQYEYVWYGQYPISDTALNGYLEQFNNLKKQLQQ